MILEESDMPLLALKKEWDICKALNYGSLLSTKIKLIQSLINYKQIAKNDKKQEKTSNNKIKHTKQTNKQTKQ